MSICGIDPRGCTIFVNCLSQPVLARGAILKSGFDYKGIAVDRQINPTRTARTPDNSLSFEFSGMVRAFASSRVIWALASISASSSTWNSPSASLKMSRDRPMM